MLAGCGDRSGDRTVRLCWLTVVNRDDRPREVTVRVTTDRGDRLDRTVSLAPRGTDGDAANLVPDERARIDVVAPRVTVASGGHRDALDLASLGIETADLFATVGTDRVRLYSAEGCPTDDSSRGSDRVSSVTLRGSRRGG